MKKGVFILILIDWVSFTIKGKTLDEIIGKVLQIEKENFTKLESGKMGYKERLMYELSVIEKMNFIDYFLIVYDFVLFAKRNNIP